jgi:hypothetical protein
MTMHKIDLSEKQTVHIQKELPLDTILSQLVCAFEGGSNYWIEEVDVVLPEGTTMDDFDYRKNGEGVFSANKYDFVEYSPLYVIPFHDGGKVLIKTTIDCKGTLENCPLAVKGTHNYVLDKASMQRGIEVMGKQFPEHFKDLVCETGDAITGDVWLQCCLFEDIIFG